VSIGQETRGSLLAELERLLASGPAAGHCVSIDFRRSPQGFADARLFFDSRSWLTSPAGEEAVRAIAGSPAVASVRVKQTAVSVRFTDAAVAEAGARLAAGGGAAAPLRPLAGKRYVVQFLDPNATKALHLGHLYEGALGHALASVLEAAGATVLRRCFVSDISRNVCEAMAGFESFYREQSPEQTGVKSDHFVGCCYAEYTRRYYEQHRDELDSTDPVAREIEPVGDLADELIRAWLEGDEGVHRLWRRLREWVLAGQRRTLADMNVDVTSFQYGSEMDQVIAAFVEQGLRQGILERGDGGAVVYPSGRPEYETVVLLRRDGFPTEHARQIAQIVALQEEARELDRYVAVMGMEWEPAFAIYEELLRRYGLLSYHEKVVYIGHSMLTVEGSKMKSSYGAVVHADEFLETLAASPEVERLAGQTGGAASPACLAEIVGKGFFISRKIRKPVAFSWDQIYDRNQNPGWLFATAWCRATAAPASGDGAAATDLWRWAVLRAEEYQRTLRETAEGLDVSRLARYLTLISETYLEAPPDAAATRAVRPLLAQGLGSLGIRTGWRQASG
jgi:arginyl-tRNA synthetase